MDANIVDCNGMQFPPMPTTSKHRCSVEGCSTKANKNLSLRFHLFPKAGENFVDIINEFGVQKKIDRRKAWKIKLRMNHKVSKNTHVCSLHFKKDDYIYPDLPAQKRYLKSNAVPSCNLPEVAEINNKLQRQLAKNWEAETNMEVCQNQEGDQQTVIKYEIDIDDESRLICPKIEISDEDETETDNIDPFSKSESGKVRMNGRNIDDSESRLLAPKIEIFDEDEQDAGKTPSTQSEDEEDPAISNDFAECELVILINTEDKLKTLTGIPSFAVLNDFVKIIESVSPKVEVNLSPIERVIITFMKLKQNMTYAVLSTMFSCSTEQYCKLMVFEILDMLCPRLRARAITWPSKREAMQNIPHCFIDFVNVRCVIDWIEIAIEKPKKQFSQLEIFTPYNGNYTTKFMIGVTPAGSISFISKAYGGYSSNKYIFKESNLISLFEKNDGLMVDEDVLIDDICKENGVKLFRPVSLANIGQLSKSDMLLNEKIVHAREYIGRINHRLKAFEILNDELPFCHLSKCEQIVTVLCALVNLS